MHTFGQTADVVVRLDRLRGPFHRNRFNDVRIQSSLNEKIHGADLFRLLLEYANEFISDQLTFSLRIAHSSQHIEKALRSIYSPNIQMQVVLKHRKHFFEFVLSQQAGVDENTDQTVSDSLRNQCSGHRGIHTAADRTQGTPVTNLFSNEINGVLYE